MKRIVTSLVWAVVVWGALGTLVRSGAFSAAIAWRLGVAAAVAIGAHRTFTLLPESARPAPPAGASRAPTGRRKLTRRREAIEAELGLRPRGLVELEHVIAFAGQRAGDVHFRLRPILREVAAERLASRHAVDLDNAPERARVLLGDPLFELVRPDRPEPADRLGPGVAPGDLHAAVLALERL
jgi:hypothetical protein